VTPDTAKLLHLIATEPLILAVRLADKFDCDIEDIETALLPHINRRVFAREVIGPNQRKATAYEMTQEFRAQVLAGQPAREPEVERRATIRDAAPGVNIDHVPVSAPPSNFTTTNLQSSVTPTVPTPRPAPAPVEQILTKAQLAVAYLKTMPGNTCSQKEMCAAIGLPPSSQPYAYLSRAVRDGELRRDGSNWLLGDGTPPVPALKDGKLVAQEESAAPPLEQTVAMLGAGAGITAMVDEELKLPIRRPLEAPAPAMRSDAEVIERLEFLRGEKFAPATAPTFRCGIWSDGILELQRGGQVVASLTREEYVEVMEFLHARAA
jgi:hypothetical protein